MTTKPSSHFKSCSNPIQSRITNLVCKFEIGDMSNSGEGYWKIVHIPDKPPFLPYQQPTVNAYAAVIDPKHANTLVRKLNQILPLEDLRHVKRIRKQRFEGGQAHLTVILCLAGENDSHFDDMPSAVLELISAYQLSTFITKICKYPAISKEEWEEQCKIWPTSYHPPTYNIDGITGFSDEESQFVCNFMKLAVDVATANGQVVNAAVIVDPSTNQVIASACDQVYSWNPTTSPETNSCEQTDNTTPSMANGIENQNNCLINSSCGETKRSDRCVSCVNPWQWSDQDLSIGSCSWHPLRHAAIVAIEDSAARDRRLFPSSEIVGDHFTEADFVQSSETCSVSKRQKTNLTNGEKDEKLNLNSKGCKPESVRPYLCTGYDIYLVWEPCTMCAMALVHQRIKRIFYAFPNSNAGALGSVYRLQGEKSLNHHYAVFNVSLPEQVLDKNSQRTSQVC